jgi:protein-tyrosine-phosphatase
MRLLFVCVENSCRSQMAEAFARGHGGDVVAFSAGSRASGVVNPRAIEFMAELGYDLHRHRSKTIAEVEEHAPYDAVVSMGCGDACPHVAARQRLDWDLPDPKHLPDDEFRAVRDDIGRRVADLIATSGPHGGRDTPHRDTGAEELPTSGGGTT